MKKYLEDKIKVITEAAVIELFKNEFAVDICSYEEYDIQHSNYESDNFDCRGEVAGEGGEGEGESIWTVSRILDKKTGEVFFVRFDGYYESWDGSDWSNNDWSIVKPQEVKVIQWF
jgi:hypothetical protein